MGLLSRVKKLLLEEEIDSFILEKGEGVPAPVLSVYMGQDAQGNERAVKITATEQILPHDFKDLDTMQTETGFYRLQIESTFSTEFHPNQATAMASTVNFLNGMLELPGLIADEANLKVHYRTVQMVAKKEFQKPLLIGILGMHRLVLDVFSELINQVGSGKMTFLDLLNQITNYMTLHADKKNP